MQKRLTGILMISALVAIGSLSVIAQEKKVRENFTWIEVGKEDTFKVIAAKIALAKVVKGAPYSATATTETTQTLSDGNQIIRKNQSKVYRDSEGRTRVERTWGTMGKWAADGEAQQSVSINDPVTGISHISVQKRPTGETPAEIVVAEDVKKPMKRRQERVSLDLELEKLKTGNSGVEGGQKKTESLGTQVIEGVSAEGNRVTLTIPAGEVGNTLPLEVVDENWYSPELQVVIMTKHRDPRSGETVYRLTNIDRTEPDRSLFERPVRKVPVNRKSPKE